MSVALVQKSVGSVVFNERAVVNTVKIENLAATGYFFEKASFWTM